MATPSQNPLGLGLGGLGVNTPGAVPAGIAGGGLSLGIGSDTKGLNPTPVQITDAHRERIQAALEDQPEHIRISPYQGEGGTRSAREFLDALHDTETGGLLRTKNKSPGTAIELAYEDGVLGFRVVPGDDALRRRLAGPINTYYSNALTETVPPTCLGIADPDSETDTEWMAAAHLTLRDPDYFKPIRHPGIAPEHFQTHPYDAITSEMVDPMATSHTNVLVQIVLRPAISLSDTESDNWYSGVGRSKKNVESTTAGLRMGALFEDMAATITGSGADDIEWSKNKEAAKATQDTSDILRAYGKVGYHLNIRIIAAGDDPEDVSRRVRETAGMYRRFYNSDYQQAFEPQFTPRRKVADMVERVATREWVDRDIIMSTEALAGVACIPTDINTPGADWNTLKIGQGVPAHTPRFDFEAHGLDRLRTPRVRKQVAILENQSTGDPLGVGWGAKYGIEAMLADKTLSTHLGIFGGTQQGKTTVATNVVSQAMSRGEGGLVIDPKGEDGEEFMAEWPYDRPEEDCIIIDLADDYGSIPQFNALEIPHVLEPGTRQHASYVEHLADNMEETVARAGGSDNYVGSIMKGFTKTLTRALALSEFDRTVTPLDIAVAATDRGNLARLTRTMDEDRLYFIQSAAERYQNDENVDLEPLSRRFDELVQPAPLRNLLASYNPTFSVYDAVAEGKWIILRFPPTAGPTEVVFGSQVLVTAAYVSKLLCDNSDPYWCVLDELHNSYPAEGSFLPMIASQAASFNFRLVTLCQAPANQLPGDIKDAIADQFKTFVAFNAGSDKNSRYVASRHTVDPGTLQDLPAYKAFLRTAGRDGRSLTDSYLVHTFEPAREAREKAEGVEARDADDIDALKARNAERYGADIETASEQAAHALGGDEYGDLAADIVEDVGDGADAESERDADIRYGISKAIYDEAALSGDDDPLDWVPVPAVMERADRYLTITVNPESEDQTAFWDAVDHLPEEDIAVDTDTTPSRIRCTKDGKTRIKQTGKSATRGGFDHSKLLWDAYLPLLRLGLVPKLATQTGGVDIDGEAWPAPDMDRRPEEFADIVQMLSDGAPVTLEAESSTRDSPAQTCWNLAKAVKRGEKCLLLVEAGKEGRVWRAMTEPPFVRREKDGAVRLYNGDNFSIDGEKVMRPDPGDGQNVWRRTAAGEYVLTDTDSDEIWATFSSAKEIFSKREAYPSEEELARADTTVPVKAPFVPNLHFVDAQGETRIPTTDDFEVIAVPKNARQPSDLGIVNDDGETVPLVPDASESETDETAETGETGESSEPSKPSKPSEPGEPDPGGHESVTDTEPERDVTVDDGGEDGSDADTVSAAWKRLQGDDDDD